MRNQLVVNFFGQAGILSHVDPATGQVGIDWQTRLPLRSDRVWNNQNPTSESSNGFECREPSVANFFLIDHSLRQSGGHHFDYVSCVARAANELGFLTTIGANRSLKKLSASDQQSIQRLGNVKRVFRETTYQPDSYLAGLQHLTRSDCGTALLHDSHSNRIVRFYNRLKNYGHRRRRDKFVQRFASDCHRYFQTLMQTPADHAFLTTVSELELMGLAVYLAKHPQSVQTTWHLQFHFNLFDGRTPEYAGQEYIAHAIRACFLAALARLPYHRIHFYTTSETLADQYNRLGVGEFHVLPYPVSRDFASGNLTDVDRRFDETDLASAIQNSENSSSFRFPKTEPFLHQSASASELASDSRDDSCHREEVRCNEIPSGATKSAAGFSRPIRITCPGEVRREKGHVDYLQPLVNEIFPTHLATGKVQIVVQRPARKWHSKKEKIELDLPGELNGVDPSFSPIEYFSHPLSQKDYVQLIKTTDCGLLFYDSRVYYSRRAGVLGELLSCGKPVIVPAGSWLAEQIQEPIFQHVDRMIDSRSLVRTIDARDFNWDSRNVPASGGVLSFDHGHHPFEFCFERDSRENYFALKFDWHWPESPGVYCRINVTQKDESGAEVGQTVRVVGFRRSAQQVNSLFRLESATKTVEVSLANAFHGSTASIKRASVQMLSTIAGGETDREIPVGQIGVIASDQADLPNCVDEIVKHYDHYSESAKAFSGHWYARHEPCRTVNHLVSVGQMVSRAA